MSPVPDWWEGRFLSPIPDWRFVYPGGRRSEVGGTKAAAPARAARKPPVPFGGKKVARPIRRQGRRCSHPAARKTLLPFGDKEGESSLPFGGTKAAARKPPVLLGRQESRPSATRKVAAPIRRQGRRCSHPAIRKSLLPFGGTKAAAPARAARKPPVPFGGKKAAAPIRRHESRRSHPAISAAPHSAKESRCSHSAIRKTLLPFGDKKVVAPIRRQGRRCSHSAARKTLLPSGGRQGRKSSHSLPFGGTKAAAPARAARKPPVPFGDKKVAAPIRR